MIAARSLLLAVVMLGFHSTANAGTKLEALREALSEPLKQLEQAQQSSGSFRQEKKLAGFPQALISTGTFQYVREDGLIWHTQDPIDSRLILKADGSGTAVGNASEPAMRAIAQMFNALFSLDLERLNESFEIELLSPTDPKPESAGWQLALTPRDENVARIAQTLEISGTSHIETVNFSGVEGDQTTIHLSNIRTDIESSEISTGQQ